MSSGANSPASSSNVADTKADSKDSKDTKDAVDAKGDKGGTDKAADKALPEKAASSAWADAEIEAVKAGLRAHGRNWAALAGAMKGGSKTAEQCKKFFYENRKKCGLDKIILEYKRVSE